MQFNQLIERYSIDIELLPEPAGDFVDGDYIEAERTAIPARGAIIHIPAKKLLEPGGYYHERDCFLYMSEPIQADGLQVRANGMIYNVIESNNNYHFAGFCKYLLRDASHMEG